MPQEVFIGVDLGTSGTRVCAIDEAENVIAEASDDLSPHKRRDPKHLFLVVKLLLSQINSKTDGKCGGLAIAGTSGSMIGLDLNNAPLGSTSLYCDKPPDSVRQRIAGLLSFSEIQSASTEVISRLFTIAADPKTRKISFEADLIASALAGETVPADTNNALKSGGDPIGRNWPLWMSRLEIDPDKLPNLVDAGTPVAKVANKLASELGFKKPPVILAGTTDGCASSLAAGLEKPGDAVTSLGSTLTLKIISEQPIFSTEYGIYSHFIMGKWLVGGASNAGGGLLDSLFGRDQLYRLSTTPIKETPVKSGYVPLRFPGERFPVSDPDLKPVLLPRPDDDKDYFLAILDSLVDWEKRGYDALEAVGAPKVSRFFSVGGGVRNAAWMATRKRDLDCVHCDPLSVHPAFGAARLARNAMFLRQNVKKH